MNIKEELLEIFEIIPAEEGIYYHIEQRLMDRFNILVEDLNDEMSAILQTVQHSDCYFDNEDRKVFSIMYKGEDTRVVTNQDRSKLITIYQIDLSKLKMEWRNTSISHPVKAPFREIAWVQV